MKESPDASIRPTKAVVRKSVFERLEPWGDKSVCDLYAGIGTLGLEALSRGAAHITFVEQDRRALAALMSNVHRCDAGEKTTITRGDVTTFLHQASRRYDVVLADPPYHATTWAVLQPLASKIVAPGGYFVMELPANAPVLAGLDVRRYGQTKVCIWQAAA